MIFTRTLLFGGIAACLFAGTAQAGELNVQLNMGEPSPVYVAPPPPPVYVAPAPYYATPSPAYVAAPWVETYDPHHRRHDWRYWHDHPGHGHAYGHDHDHDDHGHWDHH